MHFNDLLIKLRIQSLAVIVAISTLIGIFTKAGNTGLQLSMTGAAAVFVALALIWLAIFCLDFLYYNKLLVGAVKALINLEDKINNNDPINEINFSSLVESAHNRDANNREVNKKVERSFIGVLAFYGIVFTILLVIAALFACNAK